jgi:phage shock protein A
MLQRSKRIVKANLNELIKRLEKPTHVIEAAAADVKRKAIELKKQSIRIQQKSESTKHKPIAEKLLKLSNDLNDKAMAYKEKHEEYTDRIEELKARKLLAEETKYLLQYDLGVSEDDALATLRDFEKDILELEADVQAHLAML